MKFPVDGMKISIAVALVLWLTAGAFFGAAGLIDVEARSRVEEAKRVQSSKPMIYKGITFDSIEHVIAAQASDVADKSIFGWVIRLPAPLPVVVSALGFSVLGSIFRVLWNCYKDKRWPTPTEATLPQVLGMLMSLFLLAISYVLPAALTIDGRTLRPSSLISVSLFAGAFSDVVYPWIDTIANRLFRVPESLKRETEQP